MSTVSVVKKQNLIKSQEDKIKRKSNFLLIKDSLYRKNGYACFKVWKQN